MSKSGHLWCIPYGAVFLTIFQCIWHPAGVSSCQMMGIMMVHFCHQLAHQMTDLDELLSQCLASMGGVC